jgi:hypothetical protein
LSAARLAAGNETNFQSKKEIKPPVNNNNNREKIFYQLWQMNFDRSEKEQKKNI